MVTVIDYGTKHRVKNSVLNQFAFLTSANLTMNQGIWLNRILKAWIERHVPNPLSILYCARAYSDTLKNGGGFFLKFGVFFTI